MSFLKIQKYEEEVSTDKEMILEEEILDALNNFSSTEQ